MEEYYSESEYCVCENQKSADCEIEKLISKSASKKEVHFAPLLEEVNIEKYLKTGKISKVICSGDTSEQERLCDYDWVLSLRNQCVRFNTEFCFISTGTLFKKDGKVYRIAEEHQKSQAERAGINFYPQILSDMDKLFNRLSQSSFRSSFYLNQKDREYINNRDLEVIEEHAHDFISKRIAPAVILNDGKQTPMRGHPVFKAQHATATCCRGCLAKWHNIPAGRNLTDDEKNYVVNVIMEWIKRQLK